MAFLSEHQAYTYRFSGIMQTVQRFSAYRAERRKYRETLQALSALRDRDLADIGISRGEIHHVARKTAQGFAYPF